MRPLWTKAVLGAGLSLVACGGDSQVAAIGKPELAEPLPPALDREARWSAPDRRLTRFELAYAIEDVFGVDASRLHALPAPLSGIGERPDILVGNLLDVSERFRQPYREEIEALSEVIARERVAVCGETGVNECVVGELSAAAERLWRRRLHPNETVELLAQVRSATDASEQFRRGVRWLLLSDEFLLLRQQLETPTDAERARRVVSRLALTLWSSVPDRELLELAAAGRLTEPKVWARQLARMMADPRFLRFSREFSRQWLQLDRPPLFRLSPEEQQWLSEPARAEANLSQLATWLHQHLDTPVTELLYDTTEHEGSGLLQSSALLTALSTPIAGGGDESWLGRGLVVQSAFLCRDFPLASVYPHELWADHWLLAPSSQPTARPGERRLLEVRTQDEPCRRCHWQLETIGAALREYDGLGQPLTAEAEHYPPAGAPSQGVEAVRDWILASGRFESCVASKLASYVLSRTVSPLRREADATSLQQLTHLDASQHRTLRAWLLSLLSSASYLDVRGQVVSERPKPIVDSASYTEPVELPQIAEDECRDFDAQRFLTDACGSVQCHGPGSHSGALVGSELSATTALLFDGKPRADGYCSAYKSYVDPEHLEHSLVLKKLIAGGSVCGAPMPLSGGPRTLSREGIACFAQWLSR